MSRSIYETNHNRQSLVDSNNQEDNLDPEINLNTPGDEFFQEENGETDIDQSDTRSKPTREKINNKPQSYTTTYDCRSITDGDLDRQDDESWDPRHD